METLNSFQLKIYEASSVFFSGAVEFLAVPTAEGEFGVMAGHESAVVAIKEGLLKYRKDEDPEDSMRYAAVSAGIMRVEASEVLVLVESAEDPDEIDENRAKESEKAAKDLIKLRQGRLEEQLAEAKLRRALNRLDVKKKYSGIKKNLM